MLEGLFPTYRTPSLREAIDRLADTDETERGAVYTKPEVVRAILDLAGYTPARPLHRLRLLEPSFGGGDFLLPVIDRLLDAFFADGGQPERMGSLCDAVRAVEVHPAAFETTREAVLSRLAERGFGQSEARTLVDAWMRCDDFLLAPLDGHFDFVVGNPPYVRQERIPDVLLQEYRRRYKTIYDRADLYVPFFERGLSLLVPAGRLAFICANRWLKNKYGGPLRQLAATSFQLRFFIDMEGADAFHSEVIAYPAITVFERGPAGGITRIARKPEISDASLARLASAMLNGGPASDSRIDEVERAVAGGDPWLLDVPERLRLLRRLEAQFPELEAAGCKVGIGVATGADKVFIQKLDDLPVEGERKLPLVMGPDLKNGRIAWRGFGVVNPFESDGTLANLDKYPQFGAYMRSHQEVVAGRHCAQKNASGWYRTIDRIWADLTAKPKLLIPDIKGEPTVVLDEGRYYPHHNLYYVLSDEWDLPALAVLLRSSVAVLFIATYCVKMSGGFLRFQAQYLRRIHVPRWSSLSEKQRAALLGAADSHDLAAIDAAVAMAYGLSSSEAELARQVADEARVKRKTVDAPASPP